MMFFRLTNFASVILYNGADKLSFDVLFGIFMKFRNCKEIICTTCLSFSPIAPLENQLHSPLCACFLIGTLEEKSYKSYANYFFTVPKEQVIERNDVP